MPRHCQPVEQAPAARPSDPDLSPAPAGNGSGEHRRPCGPENPGRTRHPRPVSRLRCMLARLRPLVGTRHPRPAPLRQAARGHRRQAVGARHPDLRCSGAPCEAGAGRLQAPDTLDLRRSGEPCETGAGKLSATDTLDPRRCIPQRAAGTRKLSAPDPRAAPLRRAAQSRHRQAVGHRQKTTHTSGPGPETHPPGQPRHSSAVRRPCRSGPASGGSLAPGDPANSAAIVIQNP